MPRKELKNPMNDGGQCCKFGRQGAISERIVIPAKAGIQLSASCAAFKI